jgi:hypothetical protein
VARGMNCSGARAASARKKRDALRATKHSEPVRIWLSRRALGLHTTTRAAAHARVRERCDFLHRVSLTAHAMRRDARRRRVAASAAASASRMSVREK